MAVGQWIITGWEIVIPAARQHPVQGLQCVRPAIAVEAKKWPHPPVPPQVATQQAGEAVACHPQAPGCPSGTPAAPLGTAALAKRGGVLARRNPMLLWRLSGEFLLRWAERSLLGLLIQEPPRTTRALRAGAPASTGLPARARTGPWGLPGRIKPPAGKPLCPQAKGVGLAGMGHPAAQALANLALSQAAVSKACPAGGQAGRRAADIGLRQAAPATGQQLGPGWGSSGTCPAAAPRHGDP